MVSTVFFRLYFFRPCQNFRRGRIHIGTLWLRALDERNALTLRASSGYGPRLPFTPPYGTEATTYQWIPTLATPQVGSHSLKLTIGFLTAGRIDEVQECFEAMRVDTFDFDLHFLLALFAELPVEHGGEGRRGVAQYLNLP